MANREETLTFYTKHIYLFIDIFYSIFMLNKFTFIVPPRIHHISGALSARKGSTVRIECSASGNPSPNITWSRKNNLLPSGNYFIYAIIIFIIDNL